MRPGQGIEAGKLRMLDALRDQLRTEHPDMRIWKTPWGWVASPEDGADIQGPSLEELAEKLRSGR